MSDAPSAGGSPLLSLDVLRTLVAIADTGNLSAASNAVGRSPSAISTQIKKLEASLGQRLLHRARPASSFTPAGEALLVHARRMLALNGEVVSRLILPAMQGTVRIAAPDDIAEFVLPGILADLSRIYPNVTVDVAIRRDAALGSVIETRDADIALCNALPGDERSSWETVCRTQMVWVGACGGLVHRWEPVPIFLGADDCIWRDRAMAQLQEDHRRFRAAMSGVRAGGQRSAIERDMAIALWPKYLVDGDLAVLGDRDGWPPLCTYEVVMRVVPDASFPVRTVAKAMRSRFLTFEARGDHTIVVLDTG